MSNTETAEEVAQPAPSKKEDDRENGVYAGWLYLAVWFAIFLAIALYAFSRDDDETTQVVLRDDPVTTTTAAPAPGTPADLLATVNGDQVTLSGTVPGEGARVQLVNLAETLYGNGNVIDGLTIGDDIDLASGTLSVVGEAPEGDLRPDGLQRAAAQGLGVSNGAMDVEFKLPTLDPAEAVIDVSNLPVLLSGTVPDQATIDRLIVAAEATYGEGNVDASGMTIAPSSMDTGALRIVGTVPAGSNDPEDLRDVLTADFARTTVELETQIDVSEEALNEVQDNLREELAAEPILFTSGSSVISPESDAILQRVAEVIISVPEIPVAIVGHTDNQGSDGQNQTISERRAEAVMKRLVELGVETSRLSASGLGETSPIATNNTASGRAQNRRIEFLFEAEE